MFDETTPSPAPEPTPPASPAHDDPTMRSTPQPPGPNDAEHPGGSLVSPGEQPEVKDNPDKPDESTVAQVEVDADEKSEETH
jgi:hypothetical protein